MEKTLTLLRRASGSTESFGMTLLEAMRLALPQASGNLARFTVNVVDAGVDEGWLDDTRPPPAWDGVLEAWWQSSADSAEPPMREAVALAGAAFTYRVNETVQIDCARTWSAGERSPGIKGIFTVGRRSDLSREQFAKHWRDNHGPLARKHHVGLARYVQNVSLGPLTPDAIDFDGFATLHFLTGHDMRERFYDSPEGRKIISTDVKRFIGSPSMQVNCGEYNLR